MRHEALRNRAESGRSWCLRWAVCDAVGVVEGEDLVSHSNNVSVCLSNSRRGCWWLVVGGDERAERLVGFIRVGGEVDAVEVLEHPPARSQFGPDLEHLAECLDPVGGEGWSKRANCR